MFFDSYCFSSASRLKQRTYLLVTLLHNTIMSILKSSYDTAPLVWKDVYSHTPHTQGPGSVVVIATGYGLDGPGIESRWWRDFPHLSRPALGPTQPPAQWVPDLSQGVKSGQGVTLTLDPLLVPWSWKGRAISLLPLWALACTRVQFTFYLYVSNIVGSYSVRPVVYAVYGMFTCIGVCVCVLETRKLN